MSENFCPDGWCLAPEGAAVHRATRVAVIADVHLGYEWSRGARGDMIPPHSLAETQAKLAALLERMTIGLVIVAGDLVESAVPCVYTDQDVRQLRSGLAARGVELLALRGNHDPASGPGSIEVGGWTIHHGHQHVTAPRTLIGHHHPVLKAAGVVAPCFLVSANRIVLPAFTANAAGWNVATGTLPDSLGASDFRCLAGLDGTLLDFGPVSTLPARLASLRSGPPLL